MADRNVEWTKHPQPLKAIREYHGELDDGRVVRVTIRDRPNGAEIEAALRESDSEPVQIQITASREELPDEELREHALEELLAFREQMAEV